MRARARGRVGTGMAAETEPEDVPAVPRLNALVSYSLLHARVLLTSGPAQAYSYCAIGRVR
jgi:hypothetical protein